MEIITLTPYDLRKDNKLLHRMAQDIFDTFSEIEHLYWDDEPWKLEMSSLENIKNKMSSEEENYQYYVWLNTTNQIMWILWGKISYNFFLNKDRWNWTLFYSRYMSVNPKFRKQWIATALKQYFEWEAIAHHKETWNLSLVASLVKKTNESSVQRNEKNWYKKYDSGNDYLQYYKKIG